MKTKVARKVLIVVILPLLIISVGAISVSGNSPISEFKLSAGIQGAELDQFGYSVDISGDTAVVGAPAAELAYVFRYDGAVWNQEAKLVAPTSPSRYFGWDVATNGDTVVVTAFNFLYLHGSVYVFTRNGSSWDEVQELITGSGVGASVAIDGDTILVGAPYADSLSGTGLTYMFINDGTVWQQQNEVLSPPSPAPFFGWAVDLSGDTAVVGAPLTGSAYVFTRSGDSWDQGQELVIGSWLGVGSCVAVDGDSVAVAAPSSLRWLFQPPPSGQGSVFVFRRQQNGEWQSEELSPSEVDGFGKSVAISGDRLVVGAPADDVLYPNDPSCNSGSVHMFRYDGKSWVQDPLQPTLAPTLEPLLEQSDQFGWAVAIEGSKVAVGTPFGDAFSGATQDTPIMKDVGTATVFVLNEPPVAYAGAYLEVVEGEVVELDGSKSWDPDGDELSFSWVQTGGPDVKLTGADTMRPTFLAPPVVDGCNKITLELTVTDKPGGLSSKPDTVEITVLPYNRIHSTLGRTHHRFWPHWEIFTFDGTEDEEITITLEADAQGRYRGKRATLILKDMIRHVRFCRKDRRRVGNTITAKLPATGEYMLIVAEHPWFFRGRAFRGDYVLSLEGTCGKLKKISRRKRH